MNPKRPRTMNLKQENDIREHPASPTGETTQMLGRELFAERAVSDELATRLRVMCQEWREVIGTPEDNRTPGDVLERAEAALARWSGAKESDAERT